MRDWESFLTTLIVGAVFCFTISTIKSCVIENEKLNIERLKIPHKIESKHIRSVQSDGEQPQPQ